MTELFVHLKPNDMVGTTTGCVCVNLDAFPREDGGIDGTHEHLGGIQGICTFAWLDKVPDAAATNRHVGGVVRVHGRWGAGYRCKGRCACGGDDEASGQCENG